MEKYATYRIFKHKLNGSLLRIPHLADASEELQKLADLPKEV